MKLTQLNELDTQGLLFVVFYAVRGTRYNGSYLVNASNKKHAKEIVQAINPEEYYRITPMTVEQGADKYSMDPEDLLSDIRTPSPGQAEYIELTSPQDPY